MELLILLGIIAWVIPRLAKRVNESASTTPGGATRPARPAQSRALSQRVPPQPANEPAKELCPIETELHDRTDLPAWGGSLPMNAQAHETVMEGYGDHRERPSQRAMAAERDAQPVEIPGLDLTFDKDSIVAGVIFSEILARRPARRQR